MSFIPQEKVIFKRIAQFLLMLVVALLIVDYRFTFVILMDDAVFMPVKEASIKNGQLQPLLKPPVKLI